jgi:hypothetical protein
MNRHLVLGMYATTTISMIANAGTRLFAISLRRVLGDEGLDVSGIFL